MDLNARDFAYLFWFAVVAILILLWPTGRRAVGSIVEALRGKLLAVALLYAAYFAVVVAIAQSLGLWNTGLLKDTAAWFILAGLALLFRFPKTYTERGFYRRTLRRLVGVSVAVEFLVGVTAFSFGAELLLLPVVIVLALLSAAADTKPELRRVKSLFDGALGVVGLVVLVGTAISLFNVWATMDPAQLGRLFFMPFWATFFTLIFAFVVGLYANYEPKLSEINRTAANDRRARWRAKLALALAFGTRNFELGKFAPSDARELAQTDDWDEAWRYITFKRAEIRFRIAESELTARRLARYAGVEGTDWKGRPLDQREFAETKEALDHLHAFHSAQHQNDRYREDLLTIVGGLLSKTFPENEIVMTIGPKGRSWFAWRRTVTGWVFGIGAADAPPDVWTWDGPEPPDRAPGPGTDWTHEGFEGDDPRAGSRPRPGLGVRARTGAARRAIGKRGHLMGVRPVGRRRRNASKNGCHCPLMTTSTAPICMS